MCRPLCAPPAAQDADPGARLIFLPSACHLTYGQGQDDPRLLALIDRVPAELWGAKLALQLIAQRCVGLQGFAPGSGHSLLSNSEQCV